MTTWFPKLLASSFSIFSSPPALPNLPTLLFIYTPLICLLIILLRWIRVLLFHEGVLPPGPWYTRITNLPLKYHEWNGNRRIYIHDLHKKYGDSVRIGVREFAFCGKEGVKGIYGGSKGELDKTSFYGLFRQLGVRTTFSTEERMEVCVLFLLREDFWSVGLYGHFRKLDVEEEGKGRVENGFDAVFVFLNTAALFD